jgi:molybdopterin-binding protein
VRCEHGGMKLSSRNQLPGTIVVKASDVVLAVD